MTSLDVYIFGYLSILYKAPFINSSLRVHANACNNLVSLVERINNEHFHSYLGKEKKQTAPQPSVWQTLMGKLFAYLPFQQRSRSSSTLTAQQNQMRLEEWQARRDQLSAIGIGLAAMVVYAFSVGLIRIDFITKRIS